MPQTQGPGSPRSSPSHTISRSIPTPIHSDSAVTTPTHTPQDSLMGVGGDVQEAFAQGITVTPTVKDVSRCWCKTFFFFCLCVLKGPRRNLRNDLLIAADSITNTMSSLVKELNSGRNRWKFAFLNQTATADLDGFSPQRVAARLRAPRIPNLDAVTFWRQPLQSPSSHTNQGRVSYPLPQLYYRCLICSLNISAEKRCCFSCCRKWTNL